MNGVTQDELQKIVLRCTSKAQLTKELGFKFANGKIYKQITKLLDLYQISIDHFNIKKVVLAVCPCCGLSFERKNKKTITCSYSCSNTFFKLQRVSTKRNLKISQSLVNKHNSTRKIIINGKSYFNLTCLVCKNSFASTQNKIKTCSNKCLLVLKNNISDETRKKISKSVKARILNGTHKGWASRSKLKKSFPEQYVEKILEELDIEYESELKVGKWFIDFCDINNKIALEIDGKQHELPDRKQSDKNKDEFLINNGWKVFRIKWKKINLQFRQYLIETIKQIFGINKLLK